MKRIIFAVIAAVFLAGAGCQGTGTPANQTTSSPVVDHATAERAAFEARAAYGIAARVAAAYVNLPLCTTSAPPCATPAIVLQIQKAQPTARAAIDAAMDAARNPSFGMDIVSTSLAAAQASLKAFTTITDTLPKK